MPEVTALVDALLEATRPGGVEAHPVSTTVRAELYEAFLAAVNAVAEQREEAAREREAYTRSLGGA